MPATSPQRTPQADAILKATGACVRRRRKSQGVSAVAASEAAGISRVTLHRIEKGEASVTMGAYVQVLVALGLSVELVAPDQALDPDAIHRHGWLPARIRLADYPWLKQLAWQVDGSNELTPREALGIYERNWRHVDTQTLSDAERDLVDALRTAFAGEADV
jgi:transcriptional regulator with XRE-family HTH domain